MMKLIDEYKHRPDIEIWQCDNCGRIVSVITGSEVVCKYCVCRGEGEVI